MQVDVTAGRGVDGKYYVWVERNGKVFRQFGPYDDEATARTAYDHVWGAARRAAEKVGGHVIKEPGSRH